MIFSLFEFRQCAVREVFIYLFKKSFEECGISLFDPPIKLCNQDHENWRLLVEFFIIKRHERMQITLKFYAINSKLNR